MRLENLLELPKQRLGAFRIVAVSLEFGDEGLLPGDDPFAPDHMLLGLRQMALDHFAVDWLSILRNSLIWANSGLRYWFRSDRDSDPPTEQFGVDVEVTTPIALSQNF